MLAAVRTSVESVENELALYNKFVKPILSDFLRPFFSQCPVLIYGPSPRPLAIVPHALLESRQHYSPTTMSHDERIKNVQSVKVA